MENLVSLSLGEWLLQILSTIVLFLLLRKFLFGKVKAVIDERQELIRSNIDESVKANDDAQALKEKYDAMIKAAEAEAIDIIKAGTKRGEERKEELIREGQEEAKKIIDRANLEVARGKEKAIEEVKGEIIDIALYAASKALEKDLDDQRHREVISQFVQRAGGA